MNPDDQAEKELRAAVAGAVARPGEPGYDEAVAIWNGSITRRPSIVVRCTGPGDVAAALRYARSAGLEVSVRGGGHGFSGFALTEGGLMIDLTPLKSVSVDPAARTAVAGGGVTWGELDAATQAHGLAVPGGMITHTGIAGLTLGGGLGWLCTLAGLTCDNLIGAEVVTADGALHRVGPDSEPELLWALKGGGGNFGVVTAFTYRLIPVGPLVHLATFLWRPEQGAEALRAARDLIPGLPADCGSFIAGTNAPDAPFVPADLRNRPGWLLAVVGFGDAESHARAVAPVREALPPAAEHIEAIPYTRLQSMFDHTGPWGAFSYEKAAHFDELTDEVIDVMVEHQPRKTAHLSFTPILVMAGAYHDVPEDATAFSGGRSGRYVVNVTAVCPDRETFDLDRVWVRNYWEALAPHAVGKGSYINFMSEYEEDRVRAAYGAAKYDRLAAVKAQYDPDNVFHLNANIKPARDSR
ncbi:FAD-binding oxidoreductase [Actinomadura chibensis]|uniref:FAD-binding oxidoreductase n=1 Tax=Actinomadura chibensis TaxID=392828 RepID=A0A5D0N9P0_9ACTN|nr:FAD-binding oxidoreductase [Actinomadura chibensis]TYB41068.1 FAD-binding oxidoreductase [Actinomadura chibensis]